MKILRASTNRVGILGVVLGSVFFASGCDDGPKTGDKLEKLPGQDAGEKASMEHMKSLMKGAGGGSAPTKK